MMNKNIKKVIIGILLGSLLGCQQSDGKSEQPLPPELPDVPNNDLPELPDNPDLPEEPHLPNNDLPEPITIWKNGEEVYGLTYTLTEDIISEGVDGLKTIGGEVINEATITTGKDYYGIRVEGGSGINKGLIEGQGGGMYASDGGSITNEVEGIIKNDGIYGMYAFGSGSEAINRGTVSNTKDYGMYAKNGGKITNEVGGVIENGGRDGMYVTGIDSEGINRGKIFNTGRDGMYAREGGKITNEVGGIIKNGGKYGMYVTGSEGINKGIISNTNQYGMFIITGSEGINIGEISNTGHYGMYVKGSSEGINEGKISNIGSYGMYVKDGGKITNEIEGIISNTENHGMRVSGFGSEGINKGKISNTGHYGMYVSGTGSEGINKGGMIENGGDYGMSAIEGGKVTNEVGGIIKNGGNYRMAAINEGSEAINEGTLDTGFDNYIVMHGSDSATITNEGTINVEHDGSIAMEVKYGGRGINNGVINLNANNSIGILVDGKGSTYDNDRGVINVGEGANNKAIHLTNGATFMNRGAMNVEGTLDFDGMGDGKFIMGDGGTIEAESLKGDFYASGALAMGSYEDEYSTYRMLKTDNIEGDIISNSYMFDAELTEKDKYGYYDIILIKKDFNTFLEDEKLGGILEDSYEDNGDKLKLNYYDALKLISSQERFEDAIESSYGMKFYPTIIKQNFDVVRTNNRVVSDNVLKLDNNLEIGEIVLIGGGNYDLLEEELDSGLKEYDLSLYSVYFGAEKQLNKDISLGGILTLGKMDAKYDESSYSRDGYQYQTNIYLSYENDEKLKLTSMLFGGMIDSNIERSLFFGSLYEKMEDSTKDYYVGLNNKLSKRYDIGKNYIEPALEFNITYMMQDDISESGDYGVEIDGVNSTSIETGLGITFGRDIFLVNGNKINLESSAMGYVELGDPYKDLDSRFSVLSDEKVKIKGYEGSDYYGDLRIRGSYTTSKLFTLYAEGSYRIEKNNDGWGGKVGFNFMF